MSPLKLITVGWNTGRGFVEARDKELEVMQGNGGDYQTALCQAAEISSLANVVGQLADSIPNPMVRTSVKAGSFAVSYISFVVCPAVTAVKQGHVPGEVSTGTTIVCNFLAKNTGNIASTAMVVATIALPVYGHGMYAVGIIAPMAIQQVQSRLLPRRVNLVLENVLPLVSNAASFTISSIPSKAFTLYQFSTKFSWLKRFYDHKIDQATTAILKFDGPTLEELEGPVEHETNISFEQMKAMLEDDGTHFSLNHPHCTKRTWGMTPLPKSYEFSKLNDLFKKVDWKTKEKYKMIAGTLKDDDRFLDYLRTVFPKETKDKKNSQITPIAESLIIKLAEKAKKPKEVYLAEILENQMKYLVSALEGKVKPPGSQQDLDEAIENCAQILPHLLDLDVDKTEERVELEDTLLKLAVEGGEYCTRGIKRASGEIQEGILIAEQMNASDPISCFQMKLFKTLQFRRMKIVSNTFQTAMGILTALAKKEDKEKIRKIAGNQATDQDAVGIAQDIHTFDLYRLSLSLGFVPLSDYERDSIGFPDLYNWNTFRSIRMDMFKKYYEQLDDVVEELGRLHFNNYVVIPLVNGNKKLSQQEREAIFSYLTDCNDGNWSVDETQRRFNRVALTMIGIMKYDPIAACWDNVSKTDEAVLEFNEKEHQAKLKAEQDEQWEVL